MSGIGRNIILRTFLTLSKIKTKQADPPFDACTPRAKPKSGAPYIRLNALTVSEIHSATLKVIQGGRITIPQEVREIENIQEGDYVKITIEKIDRNKGVV